MNTDKHYDQDDCAIHAGGLLSLRLRSLLKFKANFFLTTLNLILQNRRDALQQQVKL